MKKQINILLFLSIFSGEFVNLLVQFDDKAPIPLEGYVVDADSFYVYIGDNKDVPCRAIPHHSIKLIDIFDPEKEKLGVLRELPIPTVETGVN